MVKKRVVALCIVALCLATVSCKKLGEPSKSMGPLHFETTRFADAIPQDYGPLIGVTQNPESSQWVGLWFQRSDGTVSAVFVNVQEGRLYNEALTIPRK